MVAALPTRNTSESERPDDLRLGLLMKAIQRGDVAAVEVVLSGDMDVNSTTPPGTTPLMSAAAHGHLEVVRALLKRGAALNQKRSDGFTALALAAFFGQEDIVRELLVRGADARSRSRSSTSPEMWATARGFLKIADLLRTAATQSTGSKVFPVSAPTIAHSPAKSSSVNEYEEDLDEITLIRQRTKPVAGLGESLISLASETGEQRRKVDLLWEFTSPPRKLEREVDPVVPFSPFSALLDRLSTSWPHSVIVFLVVTIFSAVVTFTVLKGIKRRPQQSQAQVTAATNSPQPTERTLLPAIQPVPLSTEQAKPSVNSSTEERPLEEPSSRSSDHVTAANANSLRSSEPSSIQSANRTEAKSRVSATESSYDREGVRSARAKRRAAGTATAPVNSSGPTEANPAPLAVESKQEVQRDKKAAGEIPSLPPDPIKGSTTKRKVIQWP